MKAFLPRGKLEKSGGWVRKMNTYNEEYIKHFSILWEKTRGGVKYFAAGEKKNLVQNIHPWMILFGMNSYGEAAGLLL